MRTLTDIVPDRRFFVKRMNILLTKQSLFIILARYFLLSAPQTDIFPFVPKSVKKFSKILAILGFIW